MVTAKTILEDARKLIVSQENWTPDTSQTPGPDAALLSTTQKWSVMGALIRASFDLGASLSELYSGYLLLKLALPPGVDDVEKFNNNRETYHKDVLALFDRAIQDS